MRVKRKRSDHLDQREETQTASRNKCEKKTLIETQTEPKTHISTSTHNPKSKPKATGSRKLRQDAASCKMDIRHFLKPKPTLNKHSLMNSASTATEDKAIGAQREPTNSKFNLSSKSKTYNCDQITNRTRDKLTHRQTLKDPNNHNPEQIH